MGEATPVESVDEEAAQALVELLGELLLRGIADRPEVLREAVELLQQGPQLLSEPQTTMARLDALVKQLMPSEMPPRLRPLAERVVGGLDGIAALVHADALKRVAEHPSGDVFLGFLRACKADGVEPAPEAVTLRKNLHLADIIRPGAAPLVAGQPYETLVSSMTMHLVRRAERQYAPMLRLALRLTRLRRGGSSGNMTNALGALMFDCRQTWASAGGPLGILDDRIRIIRNSDAHETTTIAGTTTTFVNANDEGTVAEALVLDARAFAELCIDFGHRCNAMAAALSAVA